MQLVRSLHVCVLRTRLIVAVSNIYLYILVASVVGLSFTAYRTKRYFYSLILF